MIFSQISIRIIAVFMAAQCLLQESILAQDTGSTIPKSESHQAFITEQSTARFLTQATFGPRPNDITALTGTSASDWILGQFNQSRTRYLDNISAFQAKLNGVDDENEAAFYLNSQANNFTFWNRAVEGNDQLRQRMVYALSQLIVISSEGSEPLSDVPEAMGYYLDILTKHAFGNYRDLLEDITYSPAMAYYLTYIGNRKADPNTGRMPDENYARELLQLFTIGLVRLRPNGDPRPDANGNEVELYTNDDITGLAKVFTGLHVRDVEEIRGEELLFFPERWKEPLSIYPEAHSPEQKKFLGLTIPPNTDLATSIDMTLDHIMANANIGPFIARQLIQRFTNSDPRAPYVTRVARAFNTGRYRLPNGTIVGTRKKGDLKATISAILFDPLNRIERSIDFRRGGKVREPVLRLTAWARAFNANLSHPEYASALYDTSGVESLNQAPFRARSVFNFYRPGYVAPGTRSGSIGMTVPELQIMNATSTPGYINSMAFLVYGEEDPELIDQMEELAEEAGITFNRSTAVRTLVPNYDALTALATDTDAMIDWLDIHLTYGALSKGTRDAMRAVLDDGDFEDTDEAEIAREKAATAVLMLLGSPDFITQQ